MGQEIIVNALPFLSLLLVNTSQPATSPAQLTPLLSQPPSKQQYIWKVEKNETLTSIADKYYGNQEYWILLWNNNPWIENPNIIEIGWKLKLQPLPAEKPAQELQKELDERLKKQQKQTFLASIKDIKPKYSLVSQPSQQEITTNFDAVYQEAGTRYGVPWQILYGLHLTETGLRDGEIYNAQGSGARGPMQFMPGTWRAYGIDGNEDGVADIDNAVDAIFGAANFLNKHGSLDNGLRSYGGNTYGVLQAARSRGLII